MPQARKNLPGNKDAKNSADSSHARWVCVFLLVAIGLIYGQTLDHVLLGVDDSGFVFANPHVTPGLTLDGIRWAFTDGPYGEWYPLAPLSHMLDCQLFGLAAWGHHLTNVLLHAATSIALFLVLWRMTDELWPSAFVAAVFAVHPQHVESVAWVAERRDVLSGLFFMLTLAAYLGYVRHGRSLWRYGLVAILFALGLMSKPMLVTLPPLLLLLDFWPLARIGAARDVPPWAATIERSSATRLVLEKLPLVVIAAGDCWMTLRTHNNPKVPLDWSLRIGNAAVSCVTYIVQFFCPIDLAIFYPYPTAGLPAWKVAGAMAILAAATAAVVFWRRRCPYLFVGWFWYLGMLSPVLGLVQVADHAMADRYMYLPGIGLYIALAWGVARLAVGSLAWRWSYCVGAGLAIVAFMLCAVWQTSFWCDDETLWIHALATTGGNAKAEVALAEAYNRQGRVDESIAFYRLAKQHATDIWPYNNLGALLAGQGRLDEGIAEYREGLEMDPNSFLLHVNLGSALARQRKFAEAKEHFYRALEINRRGVNAYVALAHLFIFEEKLDEARVELELAIAVDPLSSPAHQDLAWVLFQLGKFDESFEHYEAALKIDPNFVLAHTNLASALAARGRIDEARLHCLRALELEPNNAAARAELGKLPHSGPRRVDPSTL